MHVLDGEDIVCKDFESMLTNPDDMKAYLGKLKESCNEFHTKFERSILESISKTSGGEEFEELSQLTNQKKELKVVLDHMKLEQKIVEKKAINTMTEIENIKTELISMKEKNEKLSLEIVDFENEIDKSKELMKKQWDAVKKACKVYKDTLDIRIDVETIDHVEHVTVTFFWTENPTDKKFFVVLINQDECWKVKKIEPELSMENKYQLNYVVQFSKQSEVTNITSLLYELRKLFLKNHFHN